MYLATGYLKRSGTQILDSDNKPVILTGPFSASWIEIDGYVGTKGYMTLADFQTVAASPNLGNCIRINALQWANFEPSNGSYSAAEFAQIDKLVTWAQQTGVYLWLSFGEFTLTNYGCQPPSWIAVSDPTTDEIGFYTPTNSKYNAMRSAYQTFLATFANRYKNNPFVLIETSNEPFITGEIPAASQNAMWANYANVCSTLASAMISAGYNNPVIIPFPNFWSANSYTDVTTPNAFWDAHAYTQTMTGYQNGIIFLASIFQTALGRPWILGEWGYVTSSFTMIWDQTSWSTIVTYLKTAPLNGYMWYQYLELYGMIYALFTQAQSNWFLANLMLGGTGPVVVTPPQTLPFNENFANLNAWSIIDGTWTLIIGGVQGTSTTEALMIAGNPAWTDYSIASPITIAAAAEASIVFRYQNSTNFYWAGLGLWGHQYSISKVVNGTYSELISSGLQSANPAGTYQLQVIVSGSNIELYVNGVLALTVTDTSLTSGEIGLRTVNSTMKAASVNVTTPITPTYFVNWTITPTSGNLPFTISFSGYLSRFSNTPDAGTIVNGEIIQIQTQAPGSSTWVNTGISETTGTGTSGNGYFSGTWKLTEPGIYPGAWQFRAYYAGNSTKYLFGCDSKTRKRDLSRVNALIL